MKCALLFFALVLIPPAVAARGDAPPQAPLETPAKAIPLYPGVAPGSEKWDWSERTTTNPKGQPMVQDVRGGLHSPEAPPRRVRFTPLANRTAGANTSGDPARDRPQQHTDRVRLSRSSAG